MSEEIEITVTDELLEEFSQYFSALDDVAEFGKTTVRRATSVTAIITELRALRASIADPDFPPKHSRRLIDELRAENAELKRDAGRYHWLCEKFGVTKLPCAIERILSGDAYVADGKLGIDAAIDAAMTVSSHH